MIPVCVRVQGVRFFAGLLCICEAVVICVWIIAIGNSIAVCVWFNEDRNRRTVVAWCLIAVGCVVHGFDMEGVSSGGCWFPYDPGVFWTILRANRKELSANKRIAIKETDKPFYIICPIVFDGCVNSDRLPNRRTCGGVRDIST